jgi:hypothetical protein
MQVVLDMMDIKPFWLNSIYYSNQNDFTERSWRRFVKLQAFL